VDLELGHTEVAIADGIHGYPVLMDWDEFKVWWDERVTNNPDWKPDSYLVGGKVPGQ